METGLRVVSKCWTFSSLAEDIFALFWVFGISLRDYSEQNKIFLGFMWSANYAGFFLEKKFEKENLCRNTDPVYFFFKTGFHIIALDNLELTL